jgi:protein SMG6
MRTLLVTDIRFCELENVEQHIWKISFHNIIEASRKSMADDAEFKDQYKTLLLSLIDEVSVTRMSIMFCINTCVYRAV